jgi:hypothetical protein
MRVDGKGLLEKANAVVHLSNTWSEMRFNPTKSMMLGLARRPNIAM